MSPPPSRLEPRERPDHGLEALLQPSLAREEVYRPLYSPAANMMVAFFGGVYAALLFSGLNSQRLGRLRKDLLLYVPIALVWTLVLVWLSARLAGVGLPWPALTGHGGRDVRYLTRAVALLVCGLCYLRLRRFYVAGQLSGSSAQKPWKAGLVAVGLSAMLTFVVAFVGTALHVRLGAELP